ncbi:hypothetical protein BH09VER1_BH09VER1_27080 [soil metagenome]
MMMILKIFGQSRLLLLVGLLAMAADARGSEQNVVLGDLKVVVWSEPAKAPQPVLIFSHGFHGSATQSSALMETFAKAGYLVFAPQHRDAIYTGGTAKWTDQAAVPFAKEETWTDATYLDRAVDIRNLIKAIASDARFRKQADLSRLGLVGHSLGGYTVLGLGGAWPSWKMPGVKAILALSPYAKPFIVHDTLKGLCAPVMYQGGTRDMGISPSLHMVKGAYELSPEPKFLVEFGGAGHFAWTDLRDTDNAAIVAYGLAFLDHYVKGAPLDLSLTIPRQEVSRLRYEAEFGSNGAGYLREERARPLWQRILGFKGDE